MELAQKERSLLANIGFFLCRDGYVPQAEMVFFGLSSTAPEKVGPIIGLALCEIIKGETDNAVAMLDGRMADAGTLAPAMNLYKLVALGMAGRLDEARQVRQAMADAGMDSQILTADQLLLELSQRSAS